MIVTIDDDFKYLGYVRFQLPVGTKLEICQESGERKPRMKWDKPGGFRVETPCHLTVEPDRQ
jgi:hypothetical protein